MAGTSLTGPATICTGLPIEVKVEQALGFKSKKDIEKFGIQQFIEKCREFAIGTNY